MFNEEKFASFADTNLGKMVDRVEPAELRNVFDMVGKVMDTVEDVENDYKLDLLLLVSMDQVKHLEIVLSAIARDDQMHLVMNIVLVVQIHKCRRKWDRLDQVMNGNLDHYLNMHPFRKDQVRIVEAN